MLVGQFDLLTDELVDLAILGVGRLHDKADFCPTLAANVANNVTELLLNEVDLGTVLILDGDNLVFGLKPSVLVRSGTGYDLLDDRVAVLRLKRGTDAFQMK